MIVNGRQAWNMSTSIIEDHFKLDNSHFQWGLAEEILQFRDKSSINFLYEAQLSNKAQSMIPSGHHLQVLPPKMKITCCLCHLEHQFCKAAKAGIKVWEHYSTEYVCHGMHSGKLHHSQP
jgi:hypothetical protein